ncbi:MULTISPECIES: hypothetical protein [Pseudoalteromonas]|uniref:hypothetical protein n=1 Tax=Pseudoalteromonas TaxID=53246 RepID=UPI0002F7211B|nr:MULTISPECIES: hypothetical protein [Pseudoalteromonas]MCF2825778.1 hypothetical protein [Pseudoalteromonas sp. OF5H-5]MCF2832943.1 hypothetical protein [Pseudoalteromonas sp. DL2-H6]MCF2923662.1 hypothetical protein [Pseudoalteromonas sp. DL2-H1]
MRLTADDRINITDLFTEQVEGVAQMKNESYRSFHGVYTCLRTFTNNFGLTIILM